MKCGGVVLELEDREVSCVRNHVNTCASHLPSCEEQFQNLEQEHTRTLQTYPPANEVLRLCKNP